LLFGGREEIHSSFQWRCGRNPALRAPFE